LKHRPLPQRKGTCQVSSLAKKSQQGKHYQGVVLGAPDGRITPRVGLVLVKKLDQLLSITESIDAGVRAFKSKRRGLGIGALMVSLAETMLSGGDFLVDLDHQRHDPVGLGLRAVPDIPAWLPALTGHDAPKGRAHGKRLRRELICIAARVTRHSGRTQVHCAPARTTTLPSGRPGRRSTRCSPARTPSKGQ